MSDSSARFALPFIVPGQAQKELFHNEALTRVDAILHAVVEEGPAAEPPAAPAPGLSWIVAPGAVGAWSGKSPAIACWTVGGWRFVEPVEGMLAWNRAAGVWMRWTGNVWSEGTLPATALLIGGEQVVGPRLAEVPSPSGGTTIDAQARAAITALIATLKSHGLID